VRASRSQCKDPDRPYPMPMLQRPTWVSSCVLAAVAWAASLAVPHPVRPDAVPAPTIDFEQVREVEAREQARAISARSHPLPYATRAVGELLRRYGKSEHAGDATEASLLRRDLQRAALAADPEQLALLRALQTQLFLAAVDEDDAREGKGHPPAADLVELGGSFVRRMRGGAWWSRPALRPERVELAAVYRIRWNDLTGLAAHPSFQASANERRLDFRMRLRSFEELGIPDRGRAELNVIEALRPFDPSYPAGFARGIALIHAGAYQPAFDTFHAYLSETPDAKYGLRARNFALFAAQALTD
jgi:hypothetical protein